MKRIIFPLFASVILFQGCSFAESTNTTKAPSLDLSAMDESGSLKVTTSRTWPTSYVCTFYLQDPNNKEPYHSKPEPCSDKIEKFREPPKNLYSVPWAYQKIGNLPFELPLPLNAEQKQSPQLNATLDVYTLPAEESVKYPKDSFGLFFDKPCIGDPMCRSFLLHAGSIYPKPVQREFIDPQRNILVRQYETEKGYMVFNIAYQGVSYTVQYFPDFDHTNADRAWNVIRYLKTDAMKVENSEKNFIVEHELWKPSDRTGASNSVK